MLQLKFKYAACVRIHKIMPIMLALCLMLLRTYYAKNYASIIDSGLVCVCACVCVFACVHACVSACVCCVQKTIVLVYHLR